MTRHGLCGRNISSTLCFSQLDKCRENRATISMCSHSPFSIFVCSVMLIWFLCCFLEQTIREPPGCLVGLSALVQACSAGDGSQREKLNPSVYLSMLIRLAHIVGSGNWKAFLEMLLNALNPKDEKLI